MKLHRKWQQKHAARWVSGVLACSILASACTSKQGAASSPSGPGVHILTYSTLGSKGGFLNTVKPAFEAKTGCTIYIKTTMGAPEVLSYLDEEKQRAKIDVVAGIDPLLFERAKNSFYQTDPPSFHPKEKVIEALRDQIPSGFLPIDYGALSFVYRKSDFKGQALPTHLSDLLKPEFKQKFIVQDPRASSPGMLFFLFAQTMMVRISDLKKQWVTLAPSWEASYKMFLANDASMVWSYLTSLAYHASKGELDQYGAIEFTEGQPVQIEGMAVLNRMGNPYTANPCIEKWVNFIMTPEQQTVLVSKQFMMPVLPNVKLPKDFEAVPVLKRAAKLDVSLQKVDQLISHFGREVQGDTL